MRKEPSSLLALKKRSVAKNAMLQQRLLVSPAAPPLRLDIPGRSNYNSPQPARVDPAARHASLMSMDVPPSSSAAPPPTSDGAWRGGVFISLAIVMAIGIRLEYACNEETKTEIIAEIQLRRRSTAKKKASKKGVVLLFFS